MEDYLNVTEKRDKKRRTILLDAALPNIETEMPMLANPARNPFECYPRIGGESMLTGGQVYGND